jgi:hypothetical protein
MTNVIHLAQVPVELFGGITFLIGTAAVDGGAFLLLNICHLEPAWLSDTELFATAQPKPLHQFINFHRSSVGRQMRLLLVWFYPASLMPIE